VRPILPADAFEIHQAQIHLVDQCCGLQPVATALAGHIAAGDAAQLRVDERDQLLESGVVALTPGQKQLRDALSHGFGCASVTHGSAS
jgi:hypothetical protein